MGDSEGAMRTFEDVEPDIHAAVRAFRTACPNVERLVAFGLCDAASAVLMAAEQIDGLAGMILANPWVRRAETLNAAVVRHYYRERIFSTEFWIKLVSGKLPIRSTATEFFQRVSPHFFSASKRQVDLICDDYISRMRVGWQLPMPKLLLLSGRDITAQEFQDLRRQDVRWTPRESARLLDEVRFADADHTFSSAERRNNAASTCSGFLKKLSQVPAQQSSGEVRAK